MDINDLDYQTLQVAGHRSTLTIRIYRPEADNSINSILVTELRSLLARIEDEKEIKVIVLEGLPDHFCMGMDFKALSDSSSDALTELDPNEYYELLKQLSVCSKVVIAKVEGKANAGGVGLVAACDIVIAGRSATFGLSEALFGLLPACILPFLIRRIGYQKALWMALTTQSITSARAYEIGLADEVSDNPDDALRKNLLRLSRLESGVIKDLKSYAFQLGQIDEETRKLSVGRFNSMMSADKVETIKNFVQNGKFPWDKQG